MNLDPNLLPATLALVASLGATQVLQRSARRVGWVDGGQSARKRADPPLPLVGGAGVLVGLLVGWLAIELLGRTNVDFVPGRALLALEPFARWPAATLWPLGAVLVAFVVGTVDDLLEDGLRPLHKLLGQAAAGFVLGLPLVVAHPTQLGAWGAALLCAFGACVALNLVNTFDNADGAAGGLALAACLAPAPLFAAAIAGFLPFNVARRGRAPRAILGDAGSHVVGILFVLVPATWPALALPALDLARLSIVRLRVGSLPWHGDRRHLAHRLQARGLAPAQVALVLLAISAPAVLLGWLGIPLVAAGFALALRFAPAPAESGAAVATGTLEPLSAADERG